MTSVVIIYHSGYGHTKKQAEAVYKGAASVPGVTAHLISVDDVKQQWETLHQADAIIFGSPTYMGSLSAPLKAFMEETSKFWYEMKWKDKIAAGFTNSASQNGDKLNTLIQMMIFAMQHGMVWVGLGMLPGNNSSKGSVEDLNRMGAFAGAMSQSNADQGAEVAPLSSDLLTAEKLGQRVAETALRWRKK